MTDVLWMLPVSEGTLVHESLSFVLSSTPMRYNAFIDGH